MINKVRNNRKLIAIVGVAGIAAGGAAACSSTPTGSAAAGCHDLEAWEVTGNGTVHQDKALQAKVEAAAHGTTFGSDFQKWATQPSIAGGQKVSADCAAAGVPQVLNGGPNGPSAAPSSPPSAKPSSPSSSASPSSPAPQTVTFETSGSAPTGVISPTIIYGAEGSSADGQVPMDVTDDIPSTPPGYYSLEIQLSDAGGNASCEILVDGHVISQASTSGADNIADCQIGYFNGQWQNENTG